MKSLKILLYVIAVYLIFIGSLYMLFPNFAESILQITLSDRSTAMVHGFGNLVMAFLAITIAGNLEKYNHMVRVFQVFAIGEAIIFGYQILSGMHTFAEVGPPLVIWGVLSVLLVLFDRKK